MNVVRSQIEPTSIKQLREKHEAALDEALTSGKIPSTFEGDPTFQNALKRRIVESKDRLRRSA